MTKLLKSAVATDLDVAGIPTGLFIDGQWSERAAKFAVSNPSDGSAVAQVSDASAEDALSALSAASPSIGFALFGSVCSLPHLRINFVPIRWTPAEPSGLAAHFPEPSGIFKYLRCQLDRFGSVKTAPPFQVHIAARKSAV